MPEIPFPSALARDIGIWSLVVIGVIYAALFYIKGAPDRVRARNEGDSSLRSDLWARITSLEASVAALTGTVAEKSRRITATERFCGAIIIRVQQTDFVLDLVLTELEALAPGNAVAKHARHLMAQFLPIDAPSKEINDQLKTMRQPGDGSGK